MPTWNPASVITGTPERVATLIRVRGNVQGVGFRPFVYRVARRAGGRGLGPERPRRRPDPCGGLAARPGQVPRGAARRGTSLGRDRRDDHRVRPGGRPPRLHDRLQRLGGSGPGPGAARPGDLRRLPWRGLRSPRPPVRLSVHELHRLRPALLDHRGLAVRPAADRHAAVRPVRGVPGGVSRPGGPAVPRPADRLRRCGPRVVLRDRDGREQARGADALAAAIESLRDGRIVALKGLGGFQLLVRADRSGPVALLRARKGRPTKPLAVMVASLEAAARLGVVGPVERRLLASPENPIVLLERRPPDRDGREIAPEVAPRLSSLGVFLPTTPLHHLLLAGLDFPVVATSGNRGEEPIATDEWDASEQLDGIADAFLDHDRPIVRGVDDSVVRVIAGRPVDAAPGARLRAPAAAGDRAAGRIGDRPAPGDRRASEGGRRALERDAGRPRPARRRHGRRLGPGRPSHGSCRTSRRCTGSSPPPWPATCTPTTSPRAGPPPGASRSSRCSTTTPMRRRAWSSTGCSTARCWP